MITKPENLNEQTLAAITHLEQHALRAHVDYATHCQTRLAANLLRSRFRVVPETVQSTNQESKNPVTQ